MAKKKPDESPANARESLEVRAAPRATPINRFLFRLFRTRLDELAHFDT